MTDAIIVQDPVTIAPWPPREVFSSDEIGELLTEGLEWEEPPLKELGPEFAPYTHVLRLAAPDRLVGAFALAEFEPEP